MSARPKSTRVAPVNYYAAASETSEESPNSGADSAPSSPVVTDLTGLFGRLYTYLDKTENNTQKIFADLKKTPSHLRNSMMLVMREKKQLIDAQEHVVAARTAQQVYHQKQYCEKLDNMLFECLSGADMGPPSPEPGEENLMSDDEYKKQLHAIKMKHTEMLTELERTREEEEAILRNLVKTQDPHRPITKNTTIDKRYAEVEEGIKKKTVNAVMLINNKCLDARRRRRNFNKDVTEILTLWFNSHIDHPYPTDEEKVHLAEVCDITIQQITNWFGNRRVRQKRQADRPLQPPSPTKRRDSSEGGSRVIRRDEGPRVVQQQQPEAARLQPKLRQPQPAAARQRSRAAAATAAAPAAAVPQQMLPQLTHSAEFFQANFGSAAGEHFQPQGLQGGHGSVLMMNGYHMMDQAMMAGFQMPTQMQAPQHIEGEKSYTSL